MTYGGANLRSEEEQIVTGREWEKEWGAVPMQTADVIAHDLSWGKFLQI